MIQFIMMLQFSVDGFREAAEVSPLTGVLVSCTLILGGIVIYLFKQLIKNKKENFSVHIKSSDKIENMAKDHIEKLEKIREQIVQDDKIRSKRDSETEREILHILNSLTQLLELSDQKNKTERILILDKLNDINRKLNTTIEALINKK